MMADIDCRRISGFYHTKCRRGRHRRVTEAARVSQAQDDGNLQRPSPTRRLHGLMIALIRRCS